MSTPANLTSAPLILRARYAKGKQGPGAGVVRDVIAAGMLLREEYTAYDAPRSYSYLIIRAVPPPTTRAARWRSLRQTTARTSTGIWRQRHHRHLVERDKRCVLEQNRTGGLLERNAPYLSQSSRNI